MIGDLLAAWPLWVAMLSLCVLMACLKPWVDRLYRDDDERSVEAHAEMRRALEKTR